MTIVMWFSRLQPGVDAADYERFVREVDYPAAEQIGSIIRYESIRIFGPATGSGELPYQFIDLAEITDIDAYRRDLAEHPAAREVHGQFERYVQSIGNFWAVPIGKEDGPQHSEGGEHLGEQAREGAGQGGYGRPKAIWFSHLQPSVTPAEYERWVQEVDYVGAKQIASIVHYRVYCVKGPCVGSPTPDLSYDYVEIAEVTSMADYLHDLETHPAAQQIIAQIGQYVRSAGGVWGQPVGRSARFG